MNDHSRHDLDELSEHLDGRLPEPRRSDVLERLRECAQCRDAHASLLWAKGQARKLRGAEAPAGLETALQAAIRPAARWRRHLPTLAAAAAVIIGLAFVLSRMMGPPPPRSLPDAIAEDVRSLTAGRIGLAVETSDARRLEAFLADQRLGFETRVLDLGMMGFALRGGSAGPIAGHPSALMVYRETATDHEILCRMLRGLAALPPPDETRQHDGIPFQVYHLGDVTVVFWPEGPVLCALAGRGEPEALVQLALGKAMKASRRD